MLALMGAVVQVEVSEVLPPAMSQATQLYMPLVKTAPQPFEGLIFLFIFFFFVALGIRSSLLLFASSLINSTTGKQRAH